MTDQTATIPAWQDGDPTMEAIAAAVYEHCEVARGTGLVIDDPRNIAAAAVAGIRDAARQAAGQPAAEAPVTLATQCDHCDHPLNWHGNSAACIFAFCGCGRFRAPADDTPAAGLAAPTNHTTEHRARARLAALIGYEPGEHDAKFEQHLDAYRAAILNSAADRFAAFDLHHEAAAIRRMAAGAES